ncbi:MAG: acyltransferase family protein [Oribacterium sp.]|nr:acyltransferase family protein [Oribacterium sp.]
MSEKSASKRLYYLDSVKYIFCLIIFWAHFTGVFWTMCEVKPDLKPGFQVLFQPPLSIFVDSNLALYGFCMLAGFLAAHKKIKSFKELVIQLITRYVRFVIPFFFINLIAFVIYYTIGFPTVISGQLLHNSWVGTYYNHAPTLKELITASLTMSGELNGPLWMMKYIFLGTCFIFIYNFVRGLIEKGASNGLGVAVMIYDIVCLLVLIYSFFHLPEPNFFHFHLVLMGVVLMRVHELIKKDNEILFMIMALLPIFLDAGGLNRIVYPFMCVHFPVISEYFKWSMYWVIGFSFFLILGIMHSPLLQKALETKSLRILASSNFSIYLIHFPLITCFSLHLYVLMVNRISYSKEFIILVVTTFMALFVAAWVYEKTVGKIQNEVIKKINDLIKKYIRS